VTLPPMLDACYAACQLVRHASLATFTKHKRRSRSCRRSARRSIWAVRQAARAGIDLI